ARYAWQDNASPGEVFLSVSWYGTGDGSGDAIATDDSTQTISQNANSFALLQTDPLEAPVGALTAAIRLMFRPAGSGAASALFDDTSFAEVEPPMERPATQTPTSSPSASSPSPTPTRTPALLPTQSPAAAPPPASESAVFPLLV